MTTPYIDPNLIFAENAPVQDKPAAFSNYDKGWDESRNNDGRPLIPQMNYLTQQADLKNLYIHENGAALPYKDGIAYEENAIVVKDGILQQWKGGVWRSAIESELADKADKTYVDDTLANKTHNSLLGRDADGSHVAGAILDASGETQQQVNYNGGAKWHSRVGGYQENERVVLANGGIVKSTIDGNTNNPNVDMTGWQKGESYNTLNPRNFGVVGDGVTDDSDAIDALLSYMQSIAQIDHRGFNMRGTGVDFSGLTCSVSRPINLMGFSNYTLIAPAFTASPDFVGDSLISIFKRSAGDWQISNVTFINPYFDCNWVCDYAVSLTDYVKVKILGGYIYRYRKKGIYSVKHPTRNCHELNLVGTFIFQTEAGENYPLDITEGEAYYIDSPDNNFSNVIIGPQKVAVGTATGGPTHFSNCHFYAGGLKKIYSSTSDHFIGCYFDGVELVLGSRSTVLGNLFVVNDGGFALTFPKDNFSIRVMDNQFRKLGTNTSVINYPTVAERGIYIPAVTDNWFDNCPSFRTSGKVWITGTSATSVTYTIPDQYLPLAIHAFGGWTNASGNAGVGDMFITTELTTPNTLTIKAYKVNASGALLPQALTGRSLYVALNM